MSVIIFLLFILEVVIFLFNITEFISIALSIGIFILNTFCNANIEFANNVYGFTVLLLVIELLVFLCKSAVENIKNRDY